MMEVLRPSGPFRYRDSVAGGGRSGRARRPRAPQGEGGKLREELVSAAGDILARTGDESAVTLRSVAREVGIAAPSIYLHFPDRDALLAAVIADRFARFARRLSTALEGTAGPAEQLRAGCLEYCAFAQEDPGSYAVLFNGVVDADLVGRGEGGDVALGSFRLLVAGVEAVMAAGLVAKAEPWHVAVKVWTGLHGAVALRRVMPDFGWNPVEELVDQLLEDTLGLAPPP